MQSIVVGLACVFRRWRAIIPEQIRLLQSMTASRLICLVTHALTEQQLLFRSRCYWRDIYLHIYLVKCCCAQSNKTLHISTGDLSLHVWKQEQHHLERFFFFSCWPLLEHKNLVSQWINYLIKNNFANCLKLCNKQKHQSLSDFSLSKLRICCF